ncbi:MAG: hypothetical protein ABI639_02190 [Thermoanaerobaculia bacterium]
MKSPQPSAFGLSLGAERVFGKFYLAMGVVAAVITLVSGLLWISRGRFMPGLEISSALALILVLLGVWHLRRAARPGAQPLGPRFMMWVPGLFTISSAARLVESLSPPRPRAIFDVAMLLFSLGSMAWLYRLHPARQRGRLGPSPETSRTDEPLADPETADG